MKTKQKWVLITFNTTTEAMRFEATCPIKGRLIPLPISKNKTTYNQIVELFL